MAEPQSLPERPMTAGEAAAVGLLRGIAAGVVMAIYLIVAGLLAGQAPAATLSNFGAGTVVAPLAGLLTHLAVAAVYGVGWGLLWQVASRYLAVPAWLAGAGYGLLLMIAGQAILIGADSPLREVPLVYMAVAHVLYGLALGWMSRN